MRGYFRPPDVDAEIDSRAPSMGPTSSISLMLLLLLGAPAALLFVADISDGDLSEPFLDLLVGYIVLFIVFGSAAFVMLSYFFLRGGLRAPLIPDVVRYALAGAAGSMAIMILIDAWDDYFTGFGLGWIMPVTGIVLGSSFGALFRGLCALLERRAV